MLMVENELTDALRAEIANAVKDLMLPTETQGLRAPQVIDGWLPTKRSTNAEDFPFIVVRAEEATTTADKTEVTVSIIIGCYSKGVEALNTDNRPYYIMDGHKHCLNVMTRIRERLGSLFNGVLNKRYILQPPMTWSMAAEQAYPLWQLDMVTKWVFNAPAVTFHTADFESEDF